MCNNIVYGIPYELGIRCMGEDVDFQRACLTIYSLMKSKTEYSPIKSVLKLKQNNASSIYGFSVLETRGQIVFIVKNSSCSVPCV